MAKKSPILSYDIYCGQCAEFRFRYRKGSKGNLLRCFLENIIQAPDLQDSQAANSKSELKNLHCLKCETLMAVPMVYKDGRLAYRMITGGFAKKKAKS